MLRSQAIKLLKDFIELLKKKTNRLKSLTDGECNAAVVATSVQMRSVRASHLREDVVDGGAKRGTDGAS